MRLLLLVNGPKERYVGGADSARQRVWQRYCAPGTELEVGYLPSQREDGSPTAIKAFGAGDAFDLAPMYPDRCAQAERDGFDAVIIHCFIDPGLEATRHRVRIPVVGPGESTLRAAAMLGRRIGMTTPSVETVPHHWAQVRSLGLEVQVAGIEGISAPMARFDLQDPGAMTDLLVGAAGKVVDLGAEVICPSGLAYIPIRVSADEVAARTGVPVLDPGFIAVRTAEMLVAATARAAIGAAS
jgi:allantoin racemase